MKKAKRIIAAVLVLAMAFVFMALSVSAATCTSCGGSGFTTVTQFVGSGSNTRVDYCTYHSGVHNHQNGALYRITKCVSCGTSSGKTYIRSAYQCPYGGVI